MSMTTIVNAHSDGSIKTSRSGWPVNITFQYANSISVTKCEYQQYPLKDHKPMDLTEKIEELEEAEREDE